jgi:hypothetical protein
VIADERPVDPAASLVDGHGRPARAADDGRCPGKDGRRCAGTRKDRVASSGFGEPHDVCKFCGHEFDEWTAR